MTEKELNEERINRFFKGKGTGDDDEYISKIFCDESMSDELRTLLKKQWYELTTEDNVKEKNLDHILYRIHYDINSSRNKSMVSVPSLIKWVASVAAILLIPIGLYLGVNARDHLGSEDIAQTEIKAPANSRTKIILPDSSVTHLNRNSTIRYKSNFITERNVELEGEAYFVVHADKTRPFSVNANNLIIEALGTKFNVASYHDENTLEIVLEEGEVLVNDTRSNRSVKMIPDELVTYNKKENKFAAEYVQTQSYTSWTEGKLVFRNDPIDVIARRLGRWYDVDVDIKGIDFDKVRLRATFTNENLEEVLYYLKLSLPIEYQIINGETSTDGTYTRKKVVFTVE